MQKTFVEPKARLVEGMTRDEICVRYRGKVQLLARRVYERLAPDASVTVDDLVSSGSLGLLEAFDRFEEARGIRFGTYAEYRIRGAMYDDLRKGDTFTRRRRELAKKIEDASNVLQRRLDRRATPQEMANYLEVSLERYHKDVAKVQPISHVCIDRPMGSQDESRPLVEQLMGPSNTEPDSRLRVQGVRDALRAAVSELPERQAQCVQMYYGKDMSLAEISQVFGVTVSRVSQILKQARLALRRRIADQVDPSDMDRR